MGEHQNKLRRGVKGNMFGLKWWVQMPLMSQWLTKPMKREDDFIVTAAFLVLRS